MSQRRPSVGLGGKPIGADSPLFGGGNENVRHAPDPEPGPPPGFDPHNDALAAPQAPLGGRGLTPLDAGLDADALRELLPAAELERDVDDWGRSERVVAAMDPLLNFYYRYWFRVEAEGVEHVPADGGALLVCNHSGALPPDGPMIMQAIRNEHAAARPLYMLGEHWFKGFPGLGAFAAKMGVVPAHPANAQRLLAEEDRLALVFPEGQKGTSKVLWQRYRLRRFGRGGFVRTALRAKVPIIPIALVGGEEAMPIIAHMRALQRMTGLLYAPLTAATYLPAKFRIRFLEPVDIASMPEDTVDDAAAVQTISEGIRARIQVSLDEMLAERQSVWMG